MILALLGATGALKTFANKSSWVDMIALVSWFDLYASLLSDFMVRCLESERIDLAQR